MDEGRPWTPRRPFPRRHRRPPTRKGSLLTAARSVSKGIVWLAGLGAAIATIIGWTQLAAAAANPYRVEYQALDRLGTGLDVAHFNAVLGSPAASMHIPGRGGEDYVERIYLQRDHIVSTVSDENDVSVQYTVLSCAPGFRPEIITPGGSVVQLNTAPLERADSSGRAPEAVHVHTHGTASTPLHVTDVMIRAGDAQSRYRGYGYGASDFCTDRVLELDAFAGPAEGLAPPSAEFRRTSPANFYVEAGDGWFLDEETMLWVVPADEKIPSGYLAEIVRG